MKLASNRLDRPPRRSLVQIGVALALSATAFGADAAGLGRLNVLSSIGQPLRAEIELTAVSRDESGLSARLASPDAFAQANIDYGAMLGSLRFSVQRRGNGTPYVLVTSNQSINEPFLDVLVELNWGAGRLVREYTLLIDPADMGGPQRGVEPGPTIVQAQGPTAITRAPAPRRPVAEPASTPTAPPRATAPAAVSAGAGGEYVVRSGDTAMSIARENRADGVPLEQMLAALYRDNPQAFAGNINRLRAGAAVRIPDAAAAQAIDGAEARRIVAQTSNFGSYRDRIARNAGTVPTTGGAGQQASGRLTTRVEDSAAPAGDARDQLKLSRGDAGARTATGANGTRSGGGVSAEELAAKDRELVEARNRLALLEKNVTDLQKLLALKSQTLTDLQRSPAPSPTPGTPMAPVATAPTVPAPPGIAPPAAAPPVVAPTAVAPTVVAPPVTAPPVAAPSAATPPAPAPTPSATEPPPAVKSAPIPAKAAPVTQPVADDGWVDWVKDNVLLIVGLLVALALLGYGLVSARRRRKLAGFEDSIFVDNSVLHANSVFGTTGGQSVDTANSGFHSNFVPVAGHLPEQSEVDPVAEADVYIAYGRDAQAEEILKEALRADASRHAVRLKLLEIYSKRGDAKTFETVASELYAATGGQGDDWKEAATLGRAIDPHNPLYNEVAAAPRAPAFEPPPPAPKPPLGGSSTASSIGVATALGAAGLAGSTLDFHGASAAAPPAAAPSPTETSPLSTELMRTDPLPRPEGTKATSDPSMDLDFDLGFTNVGSGLAPLSASTPPAATQPASDDMLSFDDDQATRPLADPFTASAFGASDPAARTAVNLPAFRARGAQDASPPISDRGSQGDTDGFTASDIFGSSIIADTEPMRDDDATKVPTPVQARTTDFRQVVDSHQFEKTEPLDAFSKINLDLENSSYEAGNATPDFSGTGTDVWQAMATKLDLALAYSDIGDKDGARELLDEVVRSGDTAQADRARQLIGELG